MRPVFQWDIGRRKLELGRRTLVMGIVNVTPDSFSDGGRYFRQEDAVDRAFGMLEEGADILDIGGESTRPGARVSPAGQQVSDKPDHAAPHFGPPDQDSVRRPVPPPSVPVEEELRRVLPVIRQIKRSAPNTVVSVDTYKAEVARQAVEAGADIVNDVSAFRWDPQMAQTVAQLGCGAVLMHMRGRPEDWRKLPAIDGDTALAMVQRELREWTAAAEEQGVRHERIVIDPGFGFGKSYDENYPILAGLGELLKLGYPLLSGTSRKSFIGRTIARNTETVPPIQRLYGTLATVTASVLAGAHIVRVHDVTPALEAVAVADAILNAGGECLRG